MDHTLPDLTPDEQAVVDAFHALYYGRRLWERTLWLGARCFKCPMDAWTYQEIIHETRPTLIVECGTARGGSALFMASMLDLLGDGRVISIDIESKPGLPQHQRITYFHGTSSTDPRTVEQVRAQVKPNDRVMLVLDSCHASDHVLAELNAYSPLVTPGCYTIVEDSNINGHPVHTTFEPDQGPGPFEAVTAFMETTDRFEVDRSRERLLMTFNPCGYLRCLK
ncbi:MAG: class I SAM-dependent methyltransferase [Phycisphaeraceae bacterium]|nr:class I SAM-dependent methyltransferase [Phycisphaeraceae bacterium]